MDLTLHLPVSLRTTRNDCSGEGASNTPREAEYEHGLVEGLVGGQVGVPLTPVQSLPLALPPSWLFRQPSDTEPPLQRIIQTSTEMERNAGLQAAPAVGRRGDIKPLKLSTHRQRLGPHS